MGETLAASTGRQNGRMVRKTDRMERRIVRRRIMVRRMVRRTVRRMEKGKGGQSGAGRMERENRAAGGSQTLKRETRALRQTGRGMRKKKTKRCKQGKRGLGLCQKDSPRKSCLHPPASPFPSHTGCSHLQGAWGNVELIPMISLILLESGSHCGKTAGSSLDDPQTPAIVLD